MPVICPHLVAVDAAWDDGPDAGRWIADFVCAAGRRRSTAAGGDVLDAHAPS
jgi:hypothetical protein